VFCRCRDRIYHISVAGIFDLITFNISHVLRATIFANLNSINLSLSKYNVFTADTLRHALTLTSDPLTLNFCCESTVCDPTRYQILAKLNNPQRSITIYIKNVGADPTLDFTVGDFNHCADSAHGSSLCLVSWTAASCKNNSNLVICIAPYYGKHHC